MIIENLNHACLKISLRNGLKILFDPWLDGIVFEGGWGLKYFNYEAHMIVIYILTQEYFRKEI